MDRFEDLDLKTLCDRLNATFSHRPPAGYLRGKTALRNAVEELLECSELEAEELVDTLESRGMLRFEGDPAARSEVDTPWHICV